MRRGQNLKTIKWLSVDECRRLFAAAKKRSRRDHALLLVSYRHGLRASEVGLLVREDVNLAANRLRFRRLKGSLDAEHPLRPDEAAAIRTYLRSRRDPLPYLFLSRKRNGITRYTLDDLMKRYGAVAKLATDRRHFHVLKHSIAVHLLNAAEDVAFVKDWLGHRDIQNTMAYAQLVSPKRDARALRVFTSREIA